MEMMLGYKQTEVGLIPEDWEIHTIGNSMQLINGRAFKPEDWKDRGIPIIRIQNLNDTESVFNYYSGPVDDKHRIEAGDILFAWSGTTGTSFGARIWSGPTGVLNQHIFKVLPDQEKLTPRFAFLVLLKVQEHIERQAHGFKASFVHVRKSDLVNIQLPVPPTKAEQEAIAEVLGKADALIETLDRLIAKKRLLKKGVMQQLLTGKRRLRGFANAATGYKQTEVGVIPEDWEVSTVGEEFSIQLGKMLDSEKNIGVPKPYIGNRAVQWGRIELNDIGFIKMTPSDLQRYRLQDGDLLVCEGGEVGRAAIWKEQMPECYYQKALHRLRSKRGYRADLLVWMLERWSAIGFLANFVTQTSIAHLPKDKFEKVQLPIPIKAEQDAIAEVLSAMDAEIALLEAQLAKYRQLKKGLMQKLLTGRIRLI